MGGDDDDVRDGVASPAEGTDPHTDNQRAREARRTLTTDDYQETREKNDQNSGQGESSGTNRQPDSASRVSQERRDAMPGQSPQIAPMPMFGNIQHPAQYQILQEPPYWNQRVAQDQTIIPAIPVVFPATAFGTTMPEVDEDQLRQICRDLGLEPSEEQHAQARAIAQAAAQAALAACYPMVHLGAVPEFNMDQVREWNSAWNHQDSAERQQQADRGEEA